MLGDKIKAGRHTKGLSQQEFADRLSVVRQTVSKWEKGLSVPDSDMLLKISDILEISVSELLEEQTPPSEAAPTEKKSGRAILIILIILGSPIWAALGIAAFAVLFSLYAVLWSLVVSAWAIFGALVGSGAGGLLGGIIIAITSNPMTGIALLGGGLLLLGLSIFTFFGALATTNGAVWLSKLPFVLIKKSSKRGGSDD